MHCRMEYTFNQVIVYVEREKKKVGYKKVLDYGKNKHNQGHRVGGKAERWKEEVKKRSSRDRMMLSQSWEMRISRRK